MTANINSVPRDLRVETFSFFDPKELGKFATVCNEWKNSVNDPRLWGGKKGPNVPKAKARYVNTIQTAQNILKRLTKEREELLNPPLKRAVNEWRVLPASFNKSETGNLIILSGATAIFTCLILSFLNTDKTVIQNLEIAAFPSVTGLMTAFAAKMGHTDIYKQVMPGMRLKVEVLNEKIEKWECIVEALYHPNRVKKMDQT